MGQTKSARTDEYSWSLLLLKETESLPQATRADSEELEIDPIYTHENWRDECKKRWNEHSIRG